MLDATTLAVDLGPRVAGFRATSLPVDTTMRLTIDVLATPADSPTGAPGVAGPAPRFRPPAVARSAGVRHSRRLRSIPAMAVTTPASTGAAGTREKDLTLAVARRIKAAIEARLGIRVLLTRDDDRDLSLEDRTAVANNNKADLFISLHANASLRPDVTGASIYYAAFESTAVAGAFAGVERVPTFSGGMRDIELVAWDLAQTHHLDQSMAFAAILEERLSERVVLSARAHRSRAARRARIGQHAGGARRDGIPDQRRSGEAARRRRIAERTRSGGHRGDHQLPRLDRRRRQ